MKRSLIAIFSFALIMTLSSAYIIKYATGHAGATNSPGENNCSQCHTAGTFSNSINISLVPSALPANTFISGQTYTVGISTIFNQNAYGFRPMGIGCEILDGISVLSSNSGVITNTLVNTKIITATNGRTNITHSSPTAGNTFASLIGYQWSFIWTAPTVGDSAIIYLSVVKGPADSNPINDEIENKSLILTKNTTTTIQDPERKMSSLSIFPNPVMDNFKISYILLDNSEVKFELTDLQGKQIALIAEENQTKGFHTIKYNLPEINKGIYFVKLNINKKPETSRMIIVQ